MLLAGDSDYAAAEAAKFFPEGGVDFTETVEGDHYPEYDDDGNVIEEEEEEEEEEEPTKIDQADFEALDPFNDDEVEVTFAPGKDGKPVVSSVHQTRWEGCGC